jgi:hypothetical protein
MSGIVERTLGDSWGPTDEMVDLGSDAELTILLVDGV